LLKWLWLLNPHSKAISIIDRSVCFRDRIIAVDQLIKQMISECENRLELEERKQQENGDRLRSLI
jgi:hypothetical protein